MLTKKEKKLWHKSFDKVKDKLNSNDYEETKIYIENHLEKEFKYFNDTKTTQLAREITG